LYTLPTVRVKLPKNFEPNHAMLAKHHTTLLTPFFGKTGQKDKKEQPMREWGNRLIEEGEGDGQHNSLMVRGAQLYQ
jgi:hypothetical protein